MKHFIRLLMLMLMLMVCLPSFGAVGNVYVGNFIDLAGTNSAIPTPVPIASGGTAATSARPVGANIGTIQMSPIGGNNQILDMQTAISAFQGQLGVSYAGNLAPYFWEANGTGTGSNVWGQPINFGGSIGDAGLRTLTPILGTPTGGSPITNDALKVFNLNYGGANFYFNGNSNAMSRDRAVATNNNGSIISQADTGLYIHNLNPFSSGSFIGLPMYSANATNMFGGANSFLAAMAGGGSNYLADPFGLVGISIPDTDPVGETNQAPGYFLIGGITPYDMGLSYNTVVPGESVVHQHSWLYSYASQGSRTDGYGSAGHWISGFPLQIANVGVPTNANWKWTLAADEFTGAVTATNGITTLRTLNVQSNAYFANTNLGSFAFGNIVGSELGGFFNVNGNNIIFAGPNTATYTAMTFDVGGFNVHRFGWAYNGGTYLGGYPFAAYSKGGIWSVSQSSRTDLQDTSVAPVFTNEFWVDASGNVGITNNLTVGMALKVGSSIAVSNGTPGILYLISASGNTNITLDSTDGATRLVLGPATNVASFTVVNTNWIDGATYTNQTGRPILVIAPCKLTTTGVAGDASYTLKVAGTSSNTFAMSTLVTSIAMSYTNQIQAIVTNSGVFIFTNTSAGAGDSGAIQNGGQYIVF